MSIAWSVVVCEIFRCLEMYIFSAVLFSELFHCLTEDKESPVPLFILGRGAIRRWSFADQFTEQIVDIYFNFLVQFFVVAVTKSAVDDVFLDPLAVLVYKFFNEFFHNVYISFGASIARPLGIKPR